MSEPPTQDPFEPYRPGPTGAEEQVPPPGVDLPGQPHRSPYSYGYGYGQGQQVHPQATLVLVLGIVSVFVSLVGPVAWVLGSRAKKEIEASGGRLGGMSQVMAGYVLGIVMSVLTALMVVVVVVFVVVVLVVAVAAGS